MTSNKRTVREMGRAQMLPVLLGSGLTPAEHRKLRNAMKRLRKAHRA